MNNDLAYINTNYFQIKTSNNIIKFISLGIKNGEIIDKQQFIKDFNNNIKSKIIFNKKIKLILNKKITEKDILYYSNIFDELNYSTVKLISIINYIDNGTLITNGDYYVIYFNNILYYLEKFLLKSFIEYNKINKLKVISPNCLDKIKNCPFYYYNNFNNYFLN